MEKWMEEAAKRYPFDKTQLEEKEMWESEDDMPYVIVDGVKRHYDNGTELRQIYDELQDKDYLELYQDDPDHEDRRKEWLENYAAEAEGYEPSNPYE